MLIITMAGTKKQARILLPIIDKFMSGNTLLFAIFKALIIIGINNTKIDVIKANTIFLSFKEIYRIIRISKI